MADALVLDTSACFALLEDEAGADVVETHLVDAREGRIVKAVAPRERVGVTYGLRPCRRYGSAFTKRST